MFAREVKADVLGHQIAVRTDWGVSLTTLKGYVANAKLYVDGKIADTCENIQLSKSAAAMRSVIEENGERHIIEVYITQWVRTKIKICDNGRQIAGDDLESLI